MLVDYAYDTARDVFRIYLAIVLILLPIAFLVHNRIARKKSVPAYVKDIEVSSNQTIRQFAAENRGRFLWLVTAYLLCNCAHWEQLSANIPPFATDLLDDLHDYIYPLFSFAWLWKLRQELASADRKASTGDQSIFLMPLIWTVIALKGAKVFAALLGPLALIYVVLAIRGDLSLALIISRGTNPFSAYIESFRLSKSRFSIFSWMFSGTAAFAWFVYSLSRLSLLIVYVLDLLSIPLQPHLTALLTTLADSLCAAGLVYCDSKIMTRGIKLLEEFHSQQKNQESSDGKQAN